MAFFVIKELIVIFTSAMSMPCLYLYVGCGHVLARCLSSELLVCKVYVKARGMSTQRGAFAERPRISSPSVRHLPFPGSSAVRGGKSDKHSCQYGEDEP